MCCYKTGGENCLQRPVDCNFPFPASIPTPQTLRHFTDSFFAQNVRNNPLVLISERSAIFSELRQRIRQIAETTRLKPEIVEIAEVAVFPALVRQEFRDSERKRRDNPAQVCCLLSSAVDEDYKDEYLEDERQNDKNHKSTSLRKRTSVVCSIIYYTAWQDQHRLSLAVIHYFLFYSFPLTIPKFLFILLSLRPLCKEKKTIFFFCSVYLFAQKGNDVK